MSANNWTTCPRCLARATKTYNDAVEQVAIMYGQVPVEEFDTARDALVKPNPRDFVTFREDYGISGAVTGTVKVSYAGHCDKCRLDVAFTHEYGIPGVHE